MLYTRENLTNVLRAMGFRNIKIWHGEIPGTVEIMISGFGRFRRLEPMAVLMFRREKPVTLEARITRKFFGFRLWAIKI